MKTKFTISLTEGKGSQPFRFTIKAANGEVITPSEGYAKKATAKRRALWWGKMLDAAHGGPVCKFVDLTKKKR